ncbi:MAG: hypothetical protein AAF968_15170 [Pseudomonadota bacterium]
MEAGTMLALAKLGAFALLVRAWGNSRRVAEEARQDRARRAEAAAEPAAETAVSPEPYREAA